MMDIHRLSGGSNSFERLLIQVLCATSAISVPLWL